MLTIINDFHITTKFGEIKNGKAAGITDSTTGVFSGCIPSFVAFMKVHGRTGEATAGDKLNKFRHSTVNCPPQNVRLCR